LSTRKARRASAGWGAAKQLACQSRDRCPRPERQCSQSRGPPPATRTAVFPIAGVLAGLALTNRSIVLAIVAIRIFSMAVWIEARAGGLLCRTHQRPTYQERIVQGHLTALAESGTPVEDQADQATANPRALPGDIAQIER
jgi:hypothetical protein